MPGAVSHGVGWEVVLGEESGGMGWGWLVSSRWSEESYSLG